MQEDIGKLVVRLTVGGLLLLHGIHKVLTGIGDVKAMVTDHHLPELVSYGVYLGEVLGPILVIVGVFSRVGGLLIAVNMVFAVALAGMSMIAQLNAFGGYALELEAFYLLGGVAVALLGAGRLGANIGGKWN